MARIAVVHNTLDHKGGADAVCLHVCEALARDHRVRLFTLSGPSLATLDELFGTAAASGVTIERPRGSALIARAFGGLARAAGAQMGARSAALLAFLRGRLDGVDAVVSTTNELPLGGSVQYVHYPQFRGGGVDRFWTRLAGVDDLPADAHLLANSAYTAAELDRRYGRGARVVHPPVDSIRGGPAWADREAGIVTVGRLAPDKRPLAAVRIVDRLRQAGYDLHLHLVGSTAARFAGYRERVARAAARRPYVSLHADAPRGELERLLVTHRYGLNTKPGEPFGMTVAEYVASGMVSFVPDEGGQREVVDEDPDRLYGSLAEAVRLIGDAVDRGDRPRLPRDRFAVDRFHDAIRTEVAALV